eukprot:3434709-Rhodomonas_salina.2
MREDESYSDSGPVTSTVTARGYTVDHTLRPECGDSIAAQTSASTQIQALLQNCYTQLSIFPDVKTEYLMQGDSYYCFGCRVLRVMPGLCRDCHGKKARKVQWINQQCTREDKVEDMCRTDHPDLQHPKTARHGYDCPYGPDDQLGWGVTEDTENDTSLGWDYHHMDERTRHITLFSQGMFEAVG